LLNVTLVALENPAPVITTVVPIGPLVGLKALIVGADTVNLLRVAVPYGVPTPTLPVVAPAGTSAWMRVAETMMKLSLGAPLKVTVDASIKPVPLIVTMVPSAPLVGDSELIVGGAGPTTVNVVRLAVPPGVVTAMAPLIAPAGTVA
jgi:hypothetical protein